MKATAVSKGDLVLATRAGYSFSEDALTSIVSRKDVAYGQLGVGLRQNGSLSISALITWLPDSRFREFIPRLIFNFSAVR
jgi:hypothetical protein